MKRYEPQDPRANEPGDHPRMAERKGNWRVLAVTLALVIVGLAVAWGFIY